MPSTRTTDPLTSHEAEQSVNNITDTQQAILRLLRTPMCDAELIFAYRLASEIRSAPYASESGIRSRRAELVDKGLVKQTGTYRRSPSGRRMIVWAAA